MEEYSKGKERELKESIPPAKLVEAYRDIEIYNGAHSSLFGSSIASSLSSKNKESEYQKLKDKHSGNLEQMGLEIISDTESEEEPNRVLLNIVAMPQYVEYIHDTLIPGKIDDRISAILSDLNQTLNLEIMILAKSDNQSLLIDRMIAVEAMIEEYKRLDPENKQQTLSHLEETSDYVRWYKKQGLREYLIAKENKFDKKIEEWQDESNTPMTWQRDNSLALFKSKWENVINALEEVKTNEGIYNNALKKLQEAVAFARKDLPKHTVTEPYFKLLTKVDNELLRREFEE